MTRGGALSTLAALAAGLLLGTFVVPRPGGTADALRGRSARCDSPATPIAQTTGVDPVMLTQLVRAAVREELREISSERTTGAPQRVAPREAIPAASATAPAEAEEPSAMLPQAEDLVHGAIIGGRWTENDRDALRSLLGNVTATERDALTRELIVAANRGDVRVETGGPLF